MAAAVAFGVSNTQAWGVEVPSVRVDRAHKAFFEGHMSEAVQGFEAALEDEAALQPQRALMARYLAGAAHVNLQSNEAAMAHFDQMTAGTRYQPPKP